MKKLWVTSAALLCGFSANFTLLNSPSHTCQQNLHTPTPIAKKEFDGATLGLTNPLLVNDYWYSSMVIGNKLQFYKIKNAPNSTIELVNSVEIQGWYRDSLVQKIVVAENIYWQFLVGDDGQDAAYYQLNIQNNQLTYLGQYTINNTGVRLIFNSGGIKMNQYQNKIIITYDNLWYSGGGAIMTIDLTSNKVSALIKDDNTIDQIVYTGPKIYYTKINNFTTNFGYYDLENNQNYNIAWGQKRLYSLSNIENKLYISDEENIYNLEIKQQTVQLNLIAKGLSKRSISKIFMFKNQLYVATNSYQKILFPRIKMALHKIVNKRLSLLTTYLSKISIGDDEINVMVDNNHLITFYQYNDYLAFKGGLLTIKLNLDNLTKTNYDIKIDLNNSGFAGYTYWSNNLYISKVTYNDNKTWVEFYKDNMR